MDSNTLKMTDAKSKINKHEQIWGQTFSRNQPHNLNTRESAKVNSPEVEKRLSEKIGVRILYFNLSELK